MIFSRLFSFFMVLVVVCFGCSSKALAENDLPVKVPVPASDLDGSIVKQDAPAPSTDQLHLWREPISGMEFVWVEGGCFSMGCGPWDPDCRVREQPEHEVCVDGFWMGRFEVTQGEWRKLMNTNPARHKISDNHPADRISWFDALDIIERLNARRYGLRFRLPTEAEWEFAARGRGRPEPIAGGIRADEAAWHLANSGDVPHAVGEKAANRMGIHDMSGNVREWTEDWYDPGYYQKSSVRNPQGPKQGKMRVTRGGAWNSNVSCVRTTSRAWNDPKVRMAGYGLRLVAVACQ